MKPDKAARDIVAMLLRRARAARQRMQRGELFSGAYMLDMAAETEAHKAAEIARSILVKES